MATDQSGYPDLTFLAAADLSAKQHLIMAKNSTARQVFLADSDDDVIVGVLQNKPAATGRAATVRVGGIAKVIAGGTVAAGDRVTADSDGKAIKSLYSDQDLVSQLGVCIVGGASGEFIEVLVAPTIAHQGQDQA